MDPTRQTLQIDGIEAAPKVVETDSPKSEADLGAAIEAIEPLVEIPELKDQHFTITYGATGYSYESIVVPYLVGAKSLVIEDPYIRVNHQVQNFIRFCEAVLKQPTIQRIELVTSYDDKTNLQEIAERLEDVKQSLLEFDVELSIKVNENLHDREIRIDNGWVIKIGRGLDFYQRPDNWYSVGTSDFTCLLYTSPSPRDQRGSRMPSSA